MKRVLTAVAFVSVLLLSGCQMPGQIVKEEPCSLCPKCKSVTTTGILKGTTVTTVVCPSCKAEYEDPRLLDYTGTDSSVNCCEKCGTYIKKCDKCKK